MVLINKVNVVPGLKGWLLIQFDDHTKKLTDINPMMFGALKELKDDTFFEKVFVDKELQTVSWPGELDLDPDNLYKQGIDVETVKNLVQAIKNNDDFSAFINHNVV